MKKSTGINKKNIAVFISGTGSNLKSLIKYSNLKNSKLNIELVVSSNTVKPCSVAPSPVIPVRCAVVNLGNNTPLSLLLTSTSNIALLFATAPLSLMETL